MADLNCPRCDATNAPGALICVDCGSNLSRPRFDPEPTRAEPAAGSAPPRPVPAEVAGRDCPDCGTVNAADAVACQHCLRLLAAGTELALVFDAGGEVSVPPGAVLVLGRDPVQSPVADRFAMDNVSRKHATVGSAADGTAWVRDEHSTNGTFVNDHRIPNGARTSIADGDKVRLGSTPSMVVRLAPP